MEGRGSSVSRWLAVAGVGGALLLTAGGAGWMLADRGDGSRGDERAADALALSEFRDLPAMAYIQAPDSRSLLERLREEQSPEWLPGDRTVPPVSAAEFPEDLLDVTVDQRKEIFYRVLAPMMLLENERLRLDRAFIERVQERGVGALDPAEAKRFDALVERYRVDLDQDDPDFFPKLLRRVDQVPPGLALAQAANESGWGTSRFTREANNLFGEWTWQEDQGMLPRSRAEGATHFIRVFPSLDRSIRSYFFTLNVGHAYPEFREERAEMRRNGEALDSVELAGGLSAYSERGQAYVDEVRAMIRWNDLQEWDDLELQLD